MRRISQVSLLRHSPVSRCWSAWSCKSCSRRKTRSWTLRARSRRVAKETLFRHRVSTVSPGVMAPPGPEQFYTCCCCCCGEEGARTNPMEALRRAQEQCDPTCRVRLKSQTSRLQEWRGEPSLHEGSSCSCSCCCCWILASHQSLTHLQINRIQTVTSARTDKSGLEPVVFLLNFVIYTRQKHQIRFYCEFSSHGYNNVNFHIKHSGH